MKKAEVRIRVQRFLNRGRNVEDLNRLFNWLRFHSHGDPTIREVGDFAAHQDRRCKGITWERASRVFHNARIFFKFVRANQTQTPLRTTKQELLRSLTSSLELLGPADVKAGTGVGTKRAKAILDSAIMRQTEGGWFDKPLSEQESRIFDFAIRRFSPDPVFSQAELVASLTTVLQKERLITPEEVPALQEQAEFLAIYVASLMHLCEIDVDGYPVPLCIGVDKDGNVMVGAHMVGVAERVEIGTPLFETTCQAGDWSTFDDPVPSGEVFLFREPMELNDEGRLVPLR